LGLTPKNQQIEQRPEENPLSSQSQFYNKSTQNPESISVDSKQRGYGKITVKNAKNANEIHTINGDVNINYVALPPDNSKYYTLNGKLTVIFPSDLSADCSFKSFNGEFFTDFENIEKLPSTVTKTTKENEGGTTHKLTKGSAIRIGSGDKNLIFETFNGNIYIKKS
jgi:DUF4097 and DUF4098 domain-containing protein YvlB